MRYTVFALLIAVAACRGDETLTAYGAADRVWMLENSTITLTFPKPGKIAGQATCNSYTGAQTVPYPWFKAENIATTRTNCPKAATEREYLQTLARMTLSEVAGNTLILSNDAGETLTFNAQ